MPSCLVVSEPTAEEAALLAFQRRLESLDIDHAAVHDDLAQATLQHLEQQETFVVAKETVFAQAVESATQPPAAEPDQWEEVKPATPRPLATPPPPPPRAAPARPPTSEFDDPFADDAEAPMSAADLREFERLAQEADTEEKPKS